MTAPAASLSRRRPALFLDRDGVINMDRGYVYRREDFEFLPGIFDLARFAVRELGWPVVVVSNQSGIGRGYFDEAAYAALTAWMCERFADEGAPIAKVYHSPHHPEHGLGAYRMEHPWRKPRPGMILQAAEDLHLDLPRSVLIGDKASDMDAARAAGIGRTIRLAPAVQGDPRDVTVCTLAEALDALKRLAARPQDVCGSKLEGR